MVKNKSWKIPFKSIETNWIQILEITTHVWKGLTTYDVISDWCQWYIYNNLNTNNGNPWTSNGLQYTSGKCTFQIICIQSNIIDGYMADDELRICNFYYYENPHTWRYMACTKEKGHN